MVRRLVHREEGIALPVAMAALAVLSLLAAMVGASALELSSSSNRDRDSKRALAAAEAGLDVATYRVNKMGPTNGNCMTDVPTPPANGECPGLSQDLGNRARYTYYVTPVLDSASAGNCAGLPLQGDPNGALLVVQRCVTSIGEVNGVKRRAQARVASYQGKPIFPVGGILGLDGVTVNNTATVDGQIGSNGQIRLGNSSTVDGVELGPGGTVSSGGTTQLGTVVQRSPADGPFVLAPVDVGLSADPDHNVNETVTSPGNVGVTYDAATRELTLANNASLTLTGGTYNFCRIAIGNGARITVAAGAQVRIFLDSPENDPTCNRPGGGTITIGQNATFENPSGEAENLQLYIFGTSDGSNVVDFRNSAFINGAIYAPQSTVIFKNSATVVGAVAARRVEFQNDVNFTWAESLADLRGRTVPLYYRTAWRECAREPTVSGDPESGC